MKFNHIVNVEWKWSKHKEAALHRKYQRQVDSAPLFADQIRQEQPSIAVVRDQREQAWKKRYISDRQNRANAWRRARAALFALPAAHRKLIRNMWNLHAWRTHEPHYLANLIHSYIKHGKRPTRLQIEKYGEAFQPVDFCSVDFRITKLPVSENTPAAKNTQAPLSLF